MNTELARDLQYRIAKEALAMLVIHGSAAETDDYERAIILIGSAWGLDPSKRRVPSGADHAGKGSGASGLPNRRNPATSCRRASCP